VADGARDRGLALSPAETFTNLPGRGVAGRVGGHELLVGSTRLLEGRGQRPHPGRRRPGRCGRRRRPVPRDLRHHQAEPVLGLRLQRGRLPRSSHDHRDPLGPGYLLRPLPAIEAPLAPSPAGTSTSTSPPGPSRSATTGPPSPPPPSAPPSPRRARRSPGDPTWTVAATRLRPIGPMGSPGHRWCRSGPGTDPARWVGPGGGPCAPAWLGARAPGSTHSPDAVPRPAGTHPVAWLGARPLGSHALAWHEGCPRLNGRACAARLPSSGLAMLPLMLDLVSR
jgi:hypothetical protein